MKSSVQLSDHFTYQKLLRFTIPSIVMMFFANLFNVIDDGFFVSNFVGKDAFVAYHFEAKNREEMQNVYRKSLVIIGVMSVLLTLLSYLSARPFASVIVGYDAELLEMSVYAYRIYGFSFLFAGIGVFAGAFFTALNDSFTAGAISFIRTMVFQVGTVLLMPLFMDIDGIWYAPVVAEVLSALVAVVCLKRKKAQYQY